ncbi:MAG: hypothetical protein SFU85_10425 [Candidatus Methylacidiphilales bacterium]|nr:hypothetical protein [Candidatus Methylacidiphilales bacterium]
MNLTPIQTRLVVLAAALLVLGSGLILTRNNTPWTKSVESPMR